MGLFTSHLVLALLVSSLSAAVFMGRPVVAGRKKLREQGVQPQYRPCRPGMFDDRRQGAVTVGRPNCRRCSQCVNGYGVRRLCTQYNDTECYRCPAGWFSPSISPYDDCTRCTQCAAHQPTVQRCTRSADTQCSTNCSRGYFYNDSDRECLPCSPCRDDWGDVNGSQERIPECIRAALPRNMQCAPQSRRQAAAVVSAEVYQDGRVWTTPTIAPTSGRDRTVRARGGTTEAYTITMLVLFAAVVLCTFLFVVLVAYFCRLTKRANRHTAGRQETKSGYHNISAETSDLLTRESTYV